MSDRIAVMDHARVVQVGTPSEIYDQPRTAFVATFIGDANLLGDGRAALRPERVRLRRPGTPTDGLVSRAGGVQDVLYRGGTADVVVALDGGGTIRASVTVNEQAPWRNGDRVVAEWAEEDCRSLEPDP